MPGGIASQLVEGQPEPSPHHLPELHGPKFAGIVASEGTQLATLGEPLLRAALSHDHPPTTLKGLDHLPGLGTQAET